MEIGRQNGSVDRPRSAEGSDVIDFTRLNRERIAESIHDLETDRLEKLRHPPADAGATRPVEKQHAAPGAQDRLDVSVAARALTANEDPSEVARWSAQIAAVRNAVAEGSLATPERVERAAHKLLGG